MSWYLGQSLGLLPPSCRAMQIDSVAVPFVPHYREQFIRNYGADLMEKINDYRLVLL